MEKLYKRVNGSIQYQEAWVEDGLLYHHWGVIGQRGEHTSRPVRLFESKRKVIQAALADARQQGYESIPIEHHATLLIEFAIDGFGTDEDLSKRHALQDRMDDTLGWVGIGACDGGSIGGGTMEVCCYVVDFDVAKEVIAHDLKGTKFCDYTRIYEEEA